MSSITYDENFASSVRCVVRRWNNIGPQGVQGPIGFTGPIGPQGIAGSASSTGATGPIGSQGDQGVPGRPGPQGDVGPTGSVSSTYASFISTQSQFLDSTNPLTTPVAITYSSRTIGNIGVSGAYPTSSIVIPVSGVYKILFSAQCVSTGQHYIQIWPVVNGNSISDANTKIRMTSSNESCLTVEYLLQFNQNDILQFYMSGDSINARLIYIEGNPSTTPSTPGSPSIIVDIYRIA
jgi:hypothetical protein